MLDAEDHRQGDRACPRRKREQPGWHRRRLRDRADHLSCGFRSQPPELDIPYRSHRRSDAIHIYASRISLGAGDERVILAVGLELQFTPARRDAGVQAERASETLRRGHHLIRSLSVDEQCPRKGKDKIAAFIGPHGSFSPGNAFGACAQGGAGPNAWRRLRRRQAPTFRPGVPPAYAAATSGLTILRGSTMRSNSASVTKPNFKAAAFSVRSLSMA